MTNDVIEQSLTVSPHNLPVEVDLPVSSYLTDLAVDELCHLLTRILVRLAVTTEQNCQLPTEEVA